MSLAESEMVKRGVTTFILCTFDMMQFYARCGYDECPPLPSMKLSSAQNVENANALARIFGGTGGNNSETYVWMKKTLNP